MKEKRGISPVISIVLIVALLLVIFAVVFGVVRNVVDESAEDIEFASKCLNTELEITAASCDGSKCDVTVKKTKGDKIDGVKVVLTKDGASEVGGLDEDISNLGTKKVTITYSETPDKVETNAYFKKTSGEEYICTNSFEFTGVIA